MRLAPKIKTAAELKFQSAPGREAGRCARVPRTSRLLTGFSKFQSAPGREAGRCVAPTAWTLPSGRFNPRPAGRPGDARLPEFMEIERTFVSIRARPGGRAMRCSPEGGLRAAAEVSIRARPGGRAMPPGSNATRVRQCQFQSAPGREAGRCSALITDCFDCGTMQACASLLPWASAVGVRLLSPSAKLLKNNGLWRSRNSWHFAAAWGSRFISPGVLRNRPSGRHRTASPSPQPVR
jgi:hypothetical protein